MCLFANGLPFLLDYSVSDADKTINLTTSVISVSKRWLQIVENQCEATRQPTILVFDFFYMESATEELALQKKLPFMGSVKAKRFKGVHELVSSNVTKPGQWEAASTRTRGSCTFIIGLDTLM